MRAQNQPAERTRPTGADRHRQVADDLREETRSLQGVLQRLGPAEWSTPTPAVGWSIQDQVNHLAYFDEAAVLAIDDPDRFRQEAAALTATENFPDLLVRGHRTLSPAQSAAWFTRARGDLLGRVADTAPTLRLPWYGPDMSITSALTARLMETWAHGQDVADALGISRVPTDRLRHIAHLGVATRAFSFRLRGLPAPEQEPFVELEGPAGQTWRWGPPDSRQRVVGPAVDFCLVVTQRRHLYDTALTVVGDQAARWMSVAQAFAGAPGPGRDPLLRGEMR